MTDRPKSLPAINGQVRDAIGRIEPLAGGGPNRFTVDVEGWGLSAPTRRRLAAMLWHWFSRPAPVTEAKPAP